MKSFFQQVLIKMIFTSFEISSHFSCLLLAVPLSILFTPMLICLTLRRLLCFECGLELLRCLLHLRNCPRRPVVRSASTQLMFRVSVSFCNPNLSVTSAASSHWLSPGLRRPHGETQVLVLHGLHVEIDRWDGRDRRSLFSSDGHTICLLLQDICIGSWMLRYWQAAAFLCDVFRIVLLWCSLDLRIVHFVLVVLLCLPGL